MEAILRRFKEFEEVYERGLVEINKLIDACLYFLLRDGPVREHS